METPDFLYGAPSSAHGLSALQCPRWCIPGQQELVSASVLPLDTRSPNYLQRKSPYSSPWSTSALGLTLMMPWITLPKNRLEQPLMILAKVAR
jgi:hypothetical protein